MKDCCRREENWKGQGGKSSFDYDSAAYVKKTTKTYVECMTCGGKLLMETTRLITDRLQKKTHKGKGPDATGAKALSA